jgi:hypothetical protein
VVLRRFVLALAESGRTSVFEGCSVDSCLWLHRSFKEGSGSLGHDGVAAGSLSTCRSLPWERITARGFLGLNSSRCSPGDDRDSGSPPFSRLHGSLWVRGAHGFVGMSWYVPLTPARSSVATRSAEVCGVRFRDPCEFGYALWSVLNKRQHNRSPAVRSTGGASCC